MFAQEDTVRNSLARLGILGLALLLVQCATTSQVQSNESHAISNLRAICGAQVAFHGANGHYAQSFAELTTATPPFLDGDWSDPRSGYSFVMGGGGENFTCIAVPAVYIKTGNRAFFVDSTGVIRWADPGPADAGSRVLGE